MSRNKTDPITLEIMRNAFQSIADEMTAALIRTAYSTNIKDRRDCSCALLTRDGEVVATIENGGSSVLEVSPGRHSVRVFYGSHSSLPLQVELHRGQEVALGCRQLESLRINLFSPKRSLVLELLDGR